MIGMANYGGKHSWLWYFADCSFNPCYDCRPYSQSLWGYRGWLHGKLRSRLSCRLRTWSGVKGIVTLSKLRAWKTAWLRTNLSQGWGMVKLSHSLLTTMVSLIIVVKYKRGEFGIKTSLFFCVDPNKSWIICPNFAKVKTIISSCFGGSQKLFLISLIFSLQYFTLHCLQQKFTMKGHGSSSSLFQLPLLHCVMITWSWLVDNDMKR